MAEDDAAPIEFRLVMHRVRRTLAAKKRNWLPAFAQAPLCCFADAWQI